MEEKSLKKNAILNGVLKFSLIILPLLTFPYITRVVHAENYGKLSFTYSIVSYFDLLAALGINSYAIREGSPLRNNKKLFSKFCSEVFTLNIISTIISYILLTLLLIIWHPTDDYIKLCSIYSIEILATTISVEWFYNIREDYLFITIRTLVLQIVKMIMIFTIIKNENDYYFSALIDSMFFLTLGLINFVRARKYINLKLRFSKDILIHVKPVLILFANTMMITIYVNSDITMLGFLEDAEITGIYKVTSKIYSAFKSLINSVTVVLIPRLAKFVAEENDYKYNLLLNKLLTILLIFVAPITIGLGMTSKMLLYIGFGDEYLKGTVSLTILSVALFIAMFSNVFLNAILILNKREKIALKITSVSSIANIALNMLFIPMFSLNGAAFTTLISESIVTCLGYYYSKDLIKIKIDKELIYRVIFGVFSIIVICFSIDLLKLNIMLGFTLKVILSILSYGLIVINCKKTKVLIFNRGGFYY